MVSSSIEPVTARSRATGGAIGADVVEIDVDANCATLTWNHTTEECGYSGRRRWLQCEVSRLQWIRQSCR